jgi:hypothetical protein
MPNFKYIFIKNNVKQPVFFFKVQTSSNYSLLLP